MNVEKKNQLIERIKTLEGLTGEERSNLLDLLRTSYGLVWEDRPEEVEEHLREAMPVLIEDKDKALTDGGPDAPNHVLIEGDNLEALTMLAYTHAGKIDVIYIDPPYNTGNKDFIYNDSFVDSEDGYRHSKWLSFMAKRLRIARKLLSDKGAIFISIDDNEYANLKLLCDGVFGADLFVGTVIWEKTDSPRMDVTGFSVRHDYILVYGGEEFSLKRLASDVIPEHYNRTDENGRRYYTKPMRIMGGHISESLFYPLIAPDGTEVYPYDRKGGKSGWRWSLKKVNDESERIEWVKGKNGWNPYFRIYADNRREMPVETIWNFETVGSTRTAKNQLNTLMGDSAFSYPKPVTLIQYILRVAGENNSTVLDFFAGSGTTMHAVMQSNAEDGGQRKCILVTNNENGICENVTYERNKRVIKGYTKPNGDSVEGLSANNLRYYRTDFVPRTQSPHDLRHLVDLSTDMLCIKEDLYSPAEIDCNGKKIAKKYARRFQKDDREMIIIYEPKVIPFIVEHIKAREVKHEIKVYVNAPGRYAFDDDFSEVIDKITLCAIPDAILQAYRDVLPKAKDPELPPVNIDEDEIKKALEADSDYSYTDEKGGNL